ncbi:hypothetical protein GCM10009798_19430 [Nocardioides panacihumi]|uniref:Uncharacterized protein n=1 Tax=Nocardioides panacihumi TaxID=400774 RepID=A0ABP5C8Y1_9ACTN
MRYASAIEESPPTKPPATNALQPVLITASRPNAIGSRNPAGATRSRRGAGGAVVVAEGEADTLASCPAAAGDAAPWPGRCWPD